MQCPKIIVRFCTYIYGDLSNIHVLWPAVHRSALPEAAFWDMSDVHECLVCTRSSLQAVQQRQVTHDLLVILSTDLTTFWAISSTS